MPSISAPSDDEEAAEILDVRLAGGVPDHGLALGQHRRHHGVLRAGDGRLVEEQLRPDEPVRPHVEAPVRLDLRAEVRERVDVDVEPAPADHVSAGRRDDRLAAAGEQRAGEKDRGADAAAELLVELDLGGRAGVDAHLAVLADVHVDADADDQLDHRRDVADHRHVAQDDGLRGEEACGHDRERGVLVSDRADRSVERPRPLDHEGLVDGLGGQVLGECGIQGGVGWAARRAIVRAPW